MSFPVTTELVVNKPPVPYYAAIPSNVQPGSLVFIVGRVPYGCHRFQVNLMVGSTVSHSLRNGGDIAMHMAVRFDEMQVVRNSRRNGAWQTEERHAGFPFEQGKDFELMILVDDYDYKIAVNGKHFTEFRHRLPLHSVGVLNADGDVQLLIVEFRRELRYQQAYPWPNAPVMANTRQTIPLIHNPLIPFRHVLPNGLYPGFMLFIAGRPDPHAKRFDLNFYVGTSYYNSDIAFHFNPRLNERVVVRNSKKNGGWQTEERSEPFFPFGAGEHFDMIVQVDANKFIVAVNGQQFIDYNHRMLPLGSIKMLEIGGDVQISSIRSS